MKKEKNLINESCRFLDQSLEVLNAATPSWWDSLSPEEQAGHTLAYRRWKELMRKQNGPNWKPFKMRRST